MTDDTLAVDDTPATLRRAFDASFGRPTSQAETGLLDVLAIRVGAQHFALRLAHVSALVLRRPITRVPIRMAALLGIVSVQGVNVVAYDLGLLLGLPGCGRPGGIALTATEVSVGLVFDEFEGHLRLPHDAVTHQEPSPDDPRAPGQLARVAGTVRPILPVPSIVDEVRLLARPGSTPQEV